LNCHWGICNPPHYPYATKPRGAMGVRVRAPGPFPRMVSRGETTTSDSGYTRDFSPQGGGDPHDEPPPPRCRERCPPPHGPGRRPSGPPHGGRGRGRPPPSSAWHGRDPLAGSRGRAPIGWHDPCAWRAGPPGAWHGPGPLARGGVGALPPGGRRGRGRCPPSAGPGGAPRNASPAGLGGPHPRPDGARHPQRAGTPGKRWCGCSGS
jgi:hypothetical protein